MSGGSFIVPLGFLCGVVVRSVACTDLPCRARSADVVSGFARTRQQSSSPGWLSTSFVVLSVDILLSRQLSDRTPVGYQALWAASTNPALRRRRPLSNSFI